MKERGYYYFCSASSDRHVIQIFVQIAFNSRLDFCHCSADSGLIFIDSKKVYTLKFCCLQSSAVYLMSVKISFLADFR